MTKTVEEMMADMAKQNNAEEAKRPAPDKARVESEAKFLKKWSRGKPIVRASSDGTFWAKGNFMTKIDFKMADALVAAGFATLTGDAKRAGATLVMK